MSRCTGRESKNGKTGDRRDKQDMKNSRKSMSAVADASGDNVTAVTVHDCDVHEHASIEQ